MCFCAKCTTHQAKIPWKDNSSPERVESLPSCLPEPTWIVQPSSRSLKLDDAFTVSKLPTSQGYLPEEEVCSLFQFAAMLERLVLISAFCLDIHDLLDQQEISLNGDDASCAISRSQQRAGVLMLLMNGAQIYSLISHLHDGAPLFRFLDSSYHTVRLMLQYLELAPVAESIHWCLHGMRWNIILSLNLYQSL